MGLTPSGVAELQGTAVSLIEMGATIDDVTSMVSAHPSLGEAVTETALSAAGHPLHTKAR